MILGSIQLSGKVSACVNQAFAFWREYISIRGRRALSDDDNDHDGYNGCKQMDATIHWCVMWTNLCLLIMLSMCKVYQATCWIECPKSDWLAYRTSIDYGSEFVMCGTASVVRLLCVAIMNTGSHVSTCTICMVCTYGMLASIESNDRQRSWRGGTYRAGRYESTRLNDVFSHPRHRSPALAKK